LIDKRSSCLDANDLTYLLVLFFIDFTFDICVRFRSEIWPIVLAVSSCWIHWFIENQSTRLFIVAVYFQLQDNLCIMFMKSTVLTDWQLLAFAVYLANSFVFILMYCLIIEDDIMIDIYWCSEINYDNSIICCRSLFWRI